MKKLLILLSLVVVLAILFAIGCGHKPKVAELPPLPPVETTTVAPPDTVVPPPPIPALALTTIHFDFDKYNLRMDAMDIMAQNADAMSKHPNAVIKIEGHCDERGSVAYNMALGEKRAGAARDYLANYGVNKGKMTIISYGKSRPADMGHTEDAWAKNRRADFIIISE